MEQQILAELREIRASIDSLTVASKKMEDHIVFIESVYEKFRWPLIAMASAIGMGRRALSQLPISLPRRQPITN
jgi:uncharacterized protein (UPF0262 family)